MCIRDSVKGVVDLRDVVYLLSAIAIFLFANKLMIDLKRGA